MDHGLETWQSLQKIRATGPLIHNITNYVVMNSTANALLALGASPAMVHAAEEVQDFVTIARALVINIGTLSPMWIASMKLAAADADSLGKPWVLDPVGAGATPWRTLVAQQLAQIGPTVLRCNASEVLALAAENREPTRGVDSTVASHAVLDTAQRLAQIYRTVVVVSGAIDYVTDGERVLEVHNGHPMMTRVTGLGCTATALVGAFLAVQQDALLAAAQAMATLGLAGEIAAERSPGPGSLQLHLLDALYTLDEAALGRVRIK
ncbi:hydroxyethylthiazole kinase [Polyangium aurulentum]|uniref:hydroxyethylthiazole kinase n=1 Tax=Polyangium aurulentum TaxID=2567896 RepID=UPI0010ADFB13|nr:hydroxyethylthiazole kinase [Polyangium aurulentum]UQA55292.1 hydroxyethylthiazole kinase [Polyangium aurulentum]